MSELPTELRQLLVEGKRALEPEPGRLDAVYQRVLRAPTSASAYDVPPARKMFSWSWVGAGVVLLGVALWPAAPPPEPKPGMPTVVAPTVVAPTVVAPIRAVEAPAVEAPVLRLPRPVEARERQVPSSDWPVAKPSRRIERERHHAPRITPSVAEPVLPAPIETSDAAPVPYETPAVRTRASDSAASLRDEVRLIARARKALDQGDLAAAQRALDAHLIEHPIGQLHNERRALLLRARCKAGDLTAARRLHAELEALAPGSSLLRSVERACPQVVP